MKPNERQVGGNHYKRISIQHWDWSAASNHDGFQYSITKYVDRWKRKGGVQDLRKALHHLEKYIEMAENDKIPSAPLHSDEIDAGPGSFGYINQD